MKYYFHEMDTILQFGQFKGETVRAASEQYHDYIRWCLTTLPSFVISDEVFEDMDIIKMLRSKNEPSYIENLKKYSDLHHSKKLLFDKQEKEHKRRIDKKEYEDSSDFEFEGKNKYDKYGGYNGYDDYTIDEAFDGDPEATWNID